MPIKMNDVIVYNVNNSENILIYFYVMPNSRVTETLISCNYLTIFTREFNTIYCSAPHIILYFMFYLSYGGPQGLQFYPMSRATLLK